MVNINPTGEARGGVYPGQQINLGANDIPVDTSLNEVRFQPPQGSTGVIGFTGLENATQGVTGISAFGATGIQGVTGFPGFTGLIGIRGNSGLFGIIGAGRGVTGLTGPTGIQGITGISPGDTGIRGLTGIIFQGDTGLIGITGAIGITGISIGSTGVQGQTGIIGPTGTMGTTGAFGFGITGLVGGTGLFGPTGVSGSSVVATSTDAGLAIVLSIPASTLAINSQQLDFIGSGLTADDAFSTTVTISYGGQNIINFNTGSIADTFTIAGTILRLTGTTQEAFASVTFDSGIIVNARAALTVTLASPQNLTLTVSSSGEGHEVTQLSAVIVR